VLSLEEKNYMKSISEEKYQKIKGNLINSISDVTISNSETGEVLFAGKCNNDFSVIGIDVSEPPSRDFSAVAMSCGSCKTIIHVESFDGEYPTKDLPKVCPKCGVKFDKTIFA
jgi:hypothetical protein